MVDLAASLKSSMSDLTFCASWNALHEKKGCWTLGGKTTGGLIMQLDHSLHEAFHLFPGQTACLCIPV